MALTSKQLGSNSRLRAASTNNPPLRPGVRGKAVRLLQEAMVELGYPMPRSTKPDGTLDGIFGEETAKRVREFEREHQLAVDRGVAGMQVLTNLDAELRGSSSPAQQRTRRPLGAAAAGPHLQQQATDRERRHRPQHGGLSEGDGDGVDIVVSPKDNPQGVILLTSPPMTMAEAGNYIWPGRYTPPASALQPVTGSTEETGLNPELGGPSLAPGGPQTRHSEFRLNLVARSREFWSNMRGGVHRLVYEHAAPFRWPSSIPRRLREVLDAWLRDERRSAEVRRFVRADYPGIAPSPALVVYLRTHGRTTDVQLYFERVTDPEYVKRSHAKRNFDLSDSLARLFAENNREINEDMLFMITRKGMSPRRARQVLRRLYETRAKLMLLGLVKVFAASAGPGRVGRKGEALVGSGNLPGAYPSNAGPLDLVAEELLNRSQR